jgi:hypothetical protein
VKNYILQIKTRRIEKYDKTSMMKVLSNVVAFSADLYSLDYNGVEHGINMGYDENDIFCIEIIINNFNFDYDIVETVDELKENFSKYGKFKVYSKIKENLKPTKIPDQYIEHYYINSYNDL